MKFKFAESIIVSNPRPDGVGIFYIYENPTFKDLNDKNETRDNRGIIDDNGNLYVESVWSEDGEPYSFMIHTTLIKYLQKKGKFLQLKLKTDKDWVHPLDSLKYGVCVQRYMDTKDFYLAESYLYDVNSGEGLERIKEIYKLAKQVNPQFNFHTQKINTKRYGQ